MIKIWKYSIPGHCEGNIRQVLGVNTQYDKPVVWVMLDDSIEEHRALDFYTIETGWELIGGDENVIKSSAYLGTIKDSEGKIFHCFCVPVEPENKSAEKEEEEEIAVAGDPIVETGNVEAQG